jgi:hypothetical protein
VSKGVRNGTQISYTIVSDVAGKIDVNE